MDARIMAAAPKLCPSLLVQSMHRSHTATSDKDGGLVLC